LIALLLTRPTLIDEARCARIGNTTKIGIGLGLLDRRPQLDKLCPCLIELLVEVRCRYHRQHIPFAHLAANIDIVDIDIACGAGKKCRAVESRHIARQLDGARSQVFLPIVVRTFGTAFFRASNTATASPLRLNWLHAPNPTNSATLVTAVTPIARAMRLR
jgi:hypothetical protein